MLRSLAIRNFVVVAALDVEFAGGFTVLTGETGAGKSILIDALQLALGGRGDAAADVRRSILSVDPASGRVRVAGELPAARSDAGAASLAGRVWVIGGRDRSGAASADAWMLGP